MPVTTDITLKHCVADMASGIPAKVGVYTVTALSLTEPHNTVPISIISVERAAIYAPVHTGSAIVP